MPSKLRSKVLCVDDDEDACEMLSELMNSFDIDATCAGSAAAAWLLIKAHHFDIVMLDAWMPGLDGFKFCRQLRDFDPETPIVFYSGAAYEADRQKGIAAGANAYVIKPDIDCLIGTITALVADAKAKAATPVWIGNDSASATTSVFGQFFSVKTASN